MQFLTILTFVGFRLLGWCWVREGGGVGVAEGWGSGEPYMGKIWIERQGKVKGA